MTKSLSHLQGLALYEAAKQITLELLTEERLQYVLQERPSKHLYPALVINHYSATKLYHGQEEADNWLELEQMVTDNLEYTLNQETPDEKE